MRILVTGGRRYANARIVAGALANFGGGQHVLVHGGANGLDRIAAKIAAEWGWGVEEHPASWATYGRRAGPLRNQRMVDAGADVLLAFPGGVGTRDCVRRAGRAAIPVISIP
jgi:predicted polyphosphate/ATP-dependent NAD kinase